MKCNRTDGECRYLHSDDSRPASVAGHAFSMVEVLFAIMILGLGFIMVAALFPVGIQQGRDAVDQTAGQTIARDAAIRAAAVFRQISKPLDLAGLVTSEYIPLSHAGSVPFTLATQTVTNGPKTGTVGGGVINLPQAATSDYKYLGENNYLSQAFYRTTYTGPVTNTGTLNIVAIALRDGRIPADVGLPLGLPYMKQCEIATDGKKNIYSDLYVRTSDSWTEAQIRDFLGTNGAIVSSQTGGITYMQQSRDNLQFGTPPGTLTWVNAYMLSKDVPLIGAYTLTTSLP